MKKSENISELVEPVKNFIGEITDISKTKEDNGDDKEPSYEYIQLSGILEKLTPILSKYGLNLVQIPECADDKITVETVLLHESGQWISETTVIPFKLQGLISGNDSYGNTRSEASNHPDEVGKYTTYARRYGLMAILERCRFIEGMGK